MSNEEKIYYKKSNAKKICGILNEANETNKIVIMCHGIRGNKDECGAFVLLSEKLLERGYSSFRFDFNGHGESDGLDKDMTITKEIDDLECTINMLKEKGYNEFVLLGSSFGAGIVSLFPFEKAPYSFDDFESGHHSIDDSHTGTEIVHKGIGASGRFGGMEQFAGLVGNPLLGCTDFGQFFCFLLAYHIQRNHGLGSFRLGIHAHLSFRRRLAKKLVSGWMINR
mgnify:CR=1 FL=1